MMNSLFSPIGEGGGGKGGGHQAVEADDTLQSSAIVTVIDLLGEGQIVGLVDHAPNTEYGAKSIYLNDTQLMTGSGAYNFKKTTFGFRDGTQSQSVIAEFPSVESPASGEGGKITKEYPKVIIIENGQNVDRVRIIISFPSGLWRQNMSNGDIDGTSVNLHFELSLNSGAYNTEGEKTYQIRGKTRSRYQKSYEFTLPKFLPDGVTKVTSWMYKIVRETADETSVNEDGALRTKYYETFYETHINITDSKLSYPNSALVYIGTDASVFTSIPSRSYLVKGLMIKIPGNYDPETRVYDGVWSGSFKIGYSNNPAWVLYDLMTSKRYGLGKHFQNSLDSMSSMVDAAFLYGIGMYCDELVDDGYGGKEPRFTINTTIQTEVEAYKLIADICSVFRGISYWNGGMACFRYDKPENPTVAYTNANVIDGDFNYAGSSRKDHHSVALVTWNDPELMYKQNVEYVEDQELVQRIGIRKMDTVAFGCTSRGQAHRAGKWILYSERYESGMITFKVGLDSALVLPGQIVRIYDALKAGKRMGGRIISSTLDSITTDAPVVIGASPGDLTLFIAMPDGSFESRTVNEKEGSHTLFTFNGDLPQLPLANAIFGISRETSGIAGEIASQLARVIEVKQDARNASQFQISAVKYNPEKYDYVERDIKFDVRPVSISMPLVGKDSNGNSIFFEFSVTEVNIKEGFRSLGTTSAFENILMVSWSGRTSTNFLLSFKVDKGNSQGEWINKVLPSSSYSYELHSLLKGDVVDVKVAAITQNGLTTNYTTATATINGKGKLNAIEGTKTLPTKVNKATFSGEAV